MRENLLSLMMTRDSIIPFNYHNDETQRSFFKKEIGKNFKFNTQFMDWMKKYKGTKTYNDAIMEWCRLKDEKKKGKKYDIAPQFKYNQYTRDFFLANSNLTRKDCIKCWNYKKSLLGSHKYDQSDLKVLL